MLFKDPICGADMNRLCICIFALHSAFIFQGCSVEMPEVPKAELTIHSVSPVELSGVNDTSTLTVNYSWKIEQYDPAKQYVMQVLLYDTNQKSPEQAAAFDLEAASGTRNDSYSGRDFYWCIFGCVRKAALPFRVYYTIEKRDGSSTYYGTTLARSREFIYN